MNSRFISSSLVKIIMIVIAGIVCIYIVLLSLPGAINKLVSRFKTHLITRLVMLIIACYLGFLLELVIYSTTINTEILWIDGLCKTTFTLLLFEIELVLLAAAIIFLQGVYAKQPELILLLVVNIIGIIYMVTSNDWLVTITAWELFNLSLYLLVMTSYQTKSSNSLSASMKYFLLSALVTTLLLLAVIVIYGLTGTTNYDASSVSLNMLSSTLNLNNSNLTYLAIITLLWKLGAAPLHNWAPDLYDSLSYPVVLWMIIIPKLAVFGLIMQIPLTQIMNAQTVFAIVGVITVLVGSIGIAAQWRIVRFISYSAITHLGFLLLTITTFNVTSYLYYIAIYAITNIILFAILLHYDLGNRHDLSGMYRINLGLSLSWALSYFSLAGIPPLAGFYAKFLILSSLLNTRTTLLLFVIAIIASALTIANYLSMIKLTHFSLPNQLGLTNYIVCSQSVSYFISLLSFALLVFGWSVFLVPKFYYLLD